MILLTKNSLTKGRRVPLASMSLNLKERDSTASMVPEDMTGISVGSWLLDDTKPGANIVWRVKSIRTAYATDTPTVELEHAICTLRDLVLFGEVTPATITGNGGSTTCTAKQAVNYILGKSSDWTLGSFDYSSVSNPYRFEGDTLWDALQTVSETLEDCWWSFDMTVYPFKLNIKKQATDVTCELRPGRNLATVTKTIDTSGMYTRFYPIGKDDLHISGNYVEKNTKTYGVISKIETDTSKETTDELTKWANRRLAKHAQPKVSITAEGAELADATGESIDRLTLGRVCRIPLAEFNTTIEERIVEARYPDKIREPERVTLTLANNQEDVATIIAQTIKEGASPSGKAARSGARSSKEDHAWFEDTSNHVAMCAIGIIGTDAKGNPNWVRLSRLEVNENGIYGEVQSVQNDVVIASTRIDQNENAITLEAKRRKDSDTDLEGRIKVEADKVGMVVEVKNGKNVIKAGSIAVAINNAGDSVANINADKILLEGSTTLNGVLKVESNRAYFKKAIRVEADVMAASLTLRTGNDSISVTEATLASTIKSASVDGNTLTLTPFRGDPINFSKATSLSGAWSSGEFPLTITASPQGNTYKVGFGQTYGTYDTTLQLINGAATAHETMSGVITVPLRVQSFRSGSTPTTRYTKNEDISVSSLLESITAAVNDTTYEPGNGKIGFSSVKVEVPEKYSNDRTFTCTGKRFTNNTWEYTFRYTINNQNLWNLDGSYTFGTNQ